MASECIFCEIIAGKISSDVVYEDGEFLAFRDIQPQAPKHFVIIPKQHIASLRDLTEKEEDLMGRLILLASKLAKKEGLDSMGYRLAINTGDEGGQAVPHLHVHLLGGRKLNDQLG
ncbi:MAG: histidine triad nucleotide-binding protein [Chloroflexota bacterium]|nr:histidine triad nucleotide-binding protein [Chloroflexota bacterium]